MDENPNGLAVIEKRSGLCPVDPLYCSRFNKDHECFNPDSGQRAWVRWLPEDEHAGG